MHQFSETELNSLLDNLRRQSALNGKSNETSLDYRNLAQTIIELGSLSPLMKDLLDVSTPLQSTALDQLLYALMTDATVHPLFKAAALRYSNVAKHSSEYWRPLRDLTYFELEAYHREPTRILVGLFPH